MPLERDAAKPKKRAPLKRTTQDQSPRRVGDMNGPKARLAWSPTDLSAKTDGEISTRKILADIESGVIPPEGVHRVGRKILIDRKAVLKYLDWDENRTT